MRSVRVCFHVRVDLRVCVETTLYIGRVTIVVDFEVTIGTLISDLALNGEALPDGHAVHAQHFNLFSHKDSRSERWSYYLAIAAEIPVHEPPMIEGPHL